MVDGARPSFLRDNRRMNVALSRAKKTLDIVCHTSLSANLPVMAAMQTAASGGIVALGHPVSMGWPVGRGNGRGNGRGRGRGYEKNTGRGKGHGHGHGKGRGRGNGSIY